MTSEQLLRSASLSHSGLASALTADGRSVAGALVFLAAAVWQTKVGAANFRDPAHVRQSGRDAVVGEFRGQIVQTVFARDHEPGAVVEIAAVENLLEELPAESRVGACA